MKKLVLILSLTLCLSANSLLKEFRAMDYQQKLIMAKTYMIGLQNDLELTLMAIAWQESKAGKYLMNLSDPSFGVFHIVPKGNDWEKSREAERLMDFEYSISKTIEILEYWKKYHKGNWQNTIKSYNAGYNYNSKKADQYLSHIQAKVRVLRKIVKGMDK